MKLLKAVSILEDGYENEIILKAEKDYMMVADERFIYIPSLDLALFNMTWLQKNEVTGDYEADWSGTAFYLNGELAGYESDEIATTFHNFFTNQMGIRLVDVDDAYISTDFNALITKNINIASENELDLDFLEAALA